MAGPCVPAVAPWRARRSPGRDRRRRPRSRSGGSRAPRESGGPRRRPRSAPDWWRPRAPATPLSCRRAGQRGALGDDQLDGTVGTHEAGVREEALRADPVAREPEPTHARHRGSGTAAEPATGGGGDGVHHREAWEEAARDDHVAPPGLHEIEEPLEVALVGA